MDSANVNYSDFNIKLIRFFRSACDLAIKIAFEFSYWFCQRARNANLFLIDVINISGFRFVQLISCSKPHRPKSVLLLTLDWSSELGTGSFGTKLAGQVVSVFGLNNVIKININDSFLAGGLSGLGP